MKKQTFTLRQIVTVADSTDSVVPLSAGV